jgi:FkbM family methyltransferase
MTIEVDEKTGLFYRTHADDSMIIGERRLYKKLLEVARPTDRFLDLGAHIGVVATMFGPHVAQVIALEPDEDNLTLLRKNVEKFNLQGKVSIIPEAVADETGTRSFYLNTKRGMCSHTLVKKRGRVEVQVPVVAFHELLDTYNPDLIKMDIEGGEYELIGDLRYLPLSVRGISIELHMNRKEWREDLAPKIHRILSEQFTVVLPPKFGPGGWGTTPLYLR